MAAKSFTKAILELTTQRIVLLGFKKRKHEIFSIEVTEDTLGLVGLNLAHSGRGPGVLEINPVIGVRNQQVERLIADLLDEPFDELSPFTVQANVGYLSADAKYRGFLFSAGESPSRTIDELVWAIETYGLAFINANKMMPALLETMESTRFAVAMYAIYRIPVLLQIMKRTTDANCFLDSELQNCSDRTDLAAQHFRRFADQFRKRWPASER